MRFLRPFRNLLIQCLFGVSEDGSPIWFDPVVGGRLTAPNTGKWRLGVMGYVGGFGLGSDFAWQIYPKVGYRFSPLFEASVAYRAIAMDFTSGSGSTEFTYDMITFGPQVGVGFHF